MMRVNLFMGGSIVIQKTGRILFIMAAFSLIFSGLAGCGDKKAETAKPVMAPSPNEIVETKAAPSGAGKEEGEVPKTGDPAGVAVEVDGVKMTNAQLDADIKKRMDAFKDEISPDKLEQARAEIRKSLVDDFVLRTLLSKEVKAKNVTVTDREVEKILDGMKSQMPPGMTLDDLVKMNKIDLAKMKGEIALNIKINKLVEQELGGKGKVDEKEIGEFYEKNLDKFKKPETVHARHILISKSPEDNEKSLTDKKAKAEDLRGKLQKGADFADLAAKNSDCPSKENGGDLGTFTRGQMVKAFEDAAFSQEKNAIGPIVETDFGFHIVQVIDHQPPATQKLDEDAKKKIRTYLESQKRQAAFDQIVKRLKTVANIVIYGK